MSLNTNTELFFQFPSETSERTLHPVEITEIAEGTVTARFHEPDLSPEPDQDILIYFEQRREFMQQSAHVSAVLETEPTTVFAFRTTGDPVSAESRECYRASTVLMDVPVEFGDERGTLQDVSATGLAVTGSPGHKFGHIVRVSFALDNVIARGTACVQSIRELPSGAVRYGLHSIGTEKPDREFRDALNRISLAVQRRQLKRLSGTG